MTSRQLRDLIEYDTSLSRAQSRVRRIFPKATDAQVARFLDGDMQVAGGTGATYQEIQASSNNSSSASYTITLASTINVGDLIIVWGLSDTSSALSAGSVTDSADGTTFGTHTWALGQSTADVGSARRFGMWYVVATTQLVSGVSKIRLTTGAATNKSLKVTTLSGATSISLDKTASSNGQASTGSPVTGTTAAGTQNVELVVAGWEWTGTSTFTAPSSPWVQTTTTQQTVNGSACSCATAYKLITNGSGATQAATAGLSPSATGGGMITSFKYTDSPPPTNTVAPAVTGNKWVGQTLTTTNGTWTGDTSSGFTYQWKDAGGNIASATASTYVIGVGEIAASIHCTVTATGTGGSTAQDSNTVGPIGRSHTPSMNAAKVDVCANSMTPVFTPGDTPGVIVIGRGDDTFDLIFLGILK